MQLVWAERSYPITGGIMMSLMFHVLLALLIVLGVPSFFKPEQLEVVPTIELATLADITAAPKVDKEGKPDDKPKTPPAPEVKKETKPEPPKPVPPKAQTPPPPSPQEQVAAIPDKPLEKAPEQKKPEPKPEEKKTEKKKPEEKPKPDKQKDDFESLLKNLTQDTPAPETPEKPKKNAAPAPAQPTTGQVAALVNDVPLTMAEQDGIRAAIERNWNIPVGMANIETYVVMLRLHLTPDGVVTKIDVLDDTGDQGFRTLAESARRAILYTQNELGRLPIPPDKFNATMIVRWNMAQICQQMTC
jgi:outer membrane biosynthesis protein TonB